MKNVLVAILKEKNELRDAREHRFYALPLDSSLVPKCVKEETVKYIAFYQPRIFEDYVYAGSAFLISGYAEISGISVMRRNEIYPGEQINELSEREYYKLDFGDFKPLPQKNIVNLRKRRINFIETIYDKLISARDINGLFHEKLGDEKLYAELVDAGISPERNYIVEYNNENFLIDFAIFCRDKKLALVYSGNRRRDTNLKSLGWELINYIDEDTADDYAKFLEKIKSIVNHSGGIEIPGEEDKYKYIYENNSGQINLFD